jgi:pyruvyltransferase
MGYSCPKIFGDPGLLLPRFFSPAVETRFQVGLVPHYIHIDRVLELYDEDPEILVIDVRREVEAVVSDILSCSVIASSSLHGLLVSHAYGIPAFQLEFSESLAGDGTKFDDYFLSVGIENPPSPLTMTSKTPGAELRAFAEELESPQIEHLLEPLLASCPFSGPKEVS